MVVENISCSISHHSYALLHMHIPAAYGSRRYAHMPRPLHRATVDLGTKIEYISPAADVVCGIEVLLWQGMDRKIQI